MLRAEPNLAYLGQFSEMTLILDEDLSFGERDFAVAFNFFDEAGCELPSSEIDAAYSENLGSYFRYLKPGSGELGSDAVKPIHLGRPAVSARVEVRPWKNKSAGAAKEMQRHIYVCVRTSESGKVWTRRIGSK
mgnify:CR=1 FL=1